MIGSNGCAVNFPPPLAATGLFKPSKAVFAPTWTSTARFSTSSRPPTTESGDLTPPNAPEQAGWRRHSGGEADTRSSPPRRVAGLQRLGQFQWEGTDIRDRLFQRAAHIDFHPAFRHFVHEFLDEGDRQLSLPHSRVEEK